MTAPDPMAEIRASFFVECEELLEALQDGLQQMDEGSADHETIHVVFRAVHSIKGGAGAFGLETLVHFAHRYETTLDAVRSGSLAVAPDLIRLFFRATDHLSDLVRAARDDTELPEEAGRELLCDLDAHTSPLDDEPIPEIEFQPLGISLDLDTSGVTESKRCIGFYITFKPAADMFDTGNDVYPILGALAGLGPCEVTCDTSELPVMDKLAPETCYLSWQIKLISDVDEAEVASMFEFVEGLCNYTIDEVFDTKHASENVGPEKSDISPNLSEPEPKAPSPPGPPPVKSTIKRSADTDAAAVKTVVRVDLDRIERLVNLVG
jgi:two-component system chemotaxis sensor kinase CheA